MNSDQKYHIVIWDAGGRCSQESCHLFHDVNSAEKFMQDTKYTNIRYAHTTVQTVEKKVVLSFGDES